ncbi:hypothetical protein QYG74_23570, partial [Xanthomonas euvesicatoria]
RVGLFDKPDDLLGAESALLHVRPLGFTDFIASAGTAQWGQVNQVSDALSILCGKGGLGVAGANKIARALVDKSWNPVMGAFQSPPEKRSCLFF